MPVYTHPEYSLPLADGHQFPMERYQHVAKGVQAISTEFGIEIRTPNLATVDKIELAHDPSFSLSLSTMREKSTYND